MLTSSAAYPLAPLYVHVVEIDRVFKKVAEGVDTFDGIFRKLESTDNINQKEKYEQDLKKEIKKLQRLRDQIKTWITSSDIKDKAPLLEQRRLIEQKMELFKACEKEMKTKAFSKEGLTLAARLDPKDKEKQDVTNWLTKSVDDLSTQVDALEAEVERLQVGLKKGKKAAEKHERIAEIDECIQRHKWHMGRLELTLRLLENGNVSVEQVQNIRDDVDYYVENNQDPDFAEDDEIYEELNLEAEEELYGVGVGDDIQSSHDSMLVHQTLMYIQLGGTRSAPASATSDRPQSPSPATSAVVAPTTSPPARKQGTQQQLYSVTAQASLGASVIKPGTGKAPTVAAVVAGGRPLLPHAPVNRNGDCITPARTRNDINQYQQMLDYGCMYLPGSLDAERPKQYVPKNMHPTPAYYPVTPSPVFDNPNLFDKLSSDSLFFIFYYQQGTYQQYLAARALKKKAWRYHKKYQTWFQRHEEPTTITDEYEMGTYIYFDYEGAWCQRKKTEFRFEYRYLEDAELV
ncbi:Not1 N-terminal domain, CCR4-Not complex component-domain-containing protein [Thamnocephalis sphaerospora]|uniref:Not1 N-terminal domain, CCR4-Not complex component-domain-containing protein n=1 Tax=Thamnocephalis sphaerospora TaxID=78915 RepID=A0A4P9XI40_9FUNG|nr:Not1 N-terminal domain, CCR4-Not complex component-domain-containing protein [Thamnocephalis sphaerospora]|eukprot:RKP05317.1 Not1 N-terminal domain, CCR4-Not complex component-domain-containing protein [Thamnocephalis sphaerospora]